MSVRAAAKKIQKSAQRGLNLPTVANNSHFAKNCQSYQNMAKRCQKIAKSCERIQKVAKQCQNWSKIVKNS